MFSLSYKWFWQLGLALLLTCTGLASCGRTSSLGTEDGVDSGQLWPDAAAGGDSGEGTDGWIAADASTTDAAHADDGTLGQDGGWVADTNPLDDAMPRPDAGWVADTNPLDDAMPRPDAEQVADGGPDPVLPDLLVKGLHGNSDGFTVSWVFSVCNDGGAAARYIYADIYFDSPTAPQVTRAGDRSIYIGALKPNSCRRFLYRREMEPRTYRSWVRVDRRQLVDELDEGNNIAGPVMFAVAPPKLPDLQVASFRAQVENGYVSYSVTACNRGTSPSDPASIGVYYDRNTPPDRNSVLDAAVDIPGLSAGGCTTLGFAARLPAGTHTSWALADPFGQVEESNERNNHAGPQEFTIAGDNRCRTTCETLQSSCRLISANELAGCIAVCERQPEATIDCAFRAAQLKQCLGIISCFIRF